MTQTLADIITGMGTRADQKSYNSYSTWAAFSFPTSALFQAIYY
jgi:hypothetical protein